MQAADYERSLRRLRLGIALFALAVAVPLAALFWQGLRQLEFETFFEERGRAERLATAIDRRLAANVVALRRYGPEEFSYYRQAGPAGAPVRSALSAWPPPGDIAGLDGYFQVSPSAGFSTPLLPADADENFATSTENASSRFDAESRLRELLTAGRPAAISQKESTPAPPAVGRSAREVAEEAIETALETPATTRSNDEARESDLNSRDNADSSGDRDEGLYSYVDRLANRRQAESPAAPSDIADAQPESLGKIDDIRLDDALNTQADAQRPLQRDPATANGGRPTATRIADTEPPQLTEDEREAIVVESGARLPASNPVAFSTLAGAPLPTEFFPLANGKAALVRRAPLEGELVIQGAVIDLERLLAETVDDTVRGWAPDEGTRVVVAFGEDVIRYVDSVGRSIGRQPQPAADLLLHRARMSPPFDELELIVTADELPSGPGSVLFGWISTTLTMILAAGCLLLYRAGVRQIRLAEQQRTFVSTVTHELKTPLTSIRMYGEMLSAGWADEKRRQQYYEYIHEESERLGRLIDNVLELSRMSRGEPIVDCRPVRGGELADLLRSKLFDGATDEDIDIRCSEDARLLDINADPDAFLQIALNLVDNAQKFGTDGEELRVECSFATTPAGDLAFEVRDYGRGIPDADLDRIFELFERGTDARRAQLPGTGIGLSIVRRLAEAMHGSVRAENRQPGAAFVVTLPAAEGSTRL